jgi:OTU domain-containing protein 6
MEKLQTTHKKEQRDLQARITQKKKSATKKTRKGINEECDALERQLKEKQDRELAGLAGEVSTDGISNDVIEDEPEETDISPIPDQPNNIQKSLESLSIASSLPSVRSERHRKQNRQKARLARRAAEQEASAARAAEEAANLPDLREQERIAMLKELEIHGLSEKEVRPDGHCLYSAIADQLAELGMALEPRVAPATTPNGVEESGDGLPGYSRVRMVAAKFISEHPDDFVPFLEEPLSEYVHKIRDTAEWGGQLEILALARAYEVQINVLQGDGGRVSVGSSESASDGKDIWLAYYRHSFGLGEHYNSLRKGR